MLKRRSTALTAMPFGKWKDVPIGLVDWEYLEWAIDSTNWYDSKPDIYAMIEKEFTRRKRIGSDADI